MGKSGYGNMLDVTTCRKHLEHALETGEVAFTTTERPVAVKNGAVKVKLVKDELPDFTQVVNAGAAWLDENAPGWHRAIDVPTLDLDDENHCVLGQSWLFYRDASDQVFTGRGDLDDDRTNFKSFLDKAFGHYDHDVRLSTAQYGFALPGIVYEWLHVRSDEIANDPKAYAEFIQAYADVTPTDLGPYDKGDILVNYKLHARVWEHLTTTWLVLIKARQAQDADRRAQLRERLAEFSLDELVTLLADANVELPTKEKP